MNMNDLPKWKGKLIKWLAGDEAIFLNINIYTCALKEGFSVVYWPPAGVKITHEEAQERAVLVATKSVIKKDA